MKRKTVWMRAAALLIAILLALPLEALAEQNGGGGSKKLSREELAQLLAPVALYPDDLVAQMLMASTYPLEVVQADRWAQQNKGLKGDALAKALEQQKWDPSVKSLVNFPEVLSTMSQKLDLTTSVGDAYLAQPKDVMETIQDLRRKAQDAGNLKSTKEQKVVVEKETIVIKPADPQVVYVPTYNPTVVYGAWPYPASPPSYYNPPPPAYAPAFAFATGVAVGMAWGYAWGHCNWNGGSINYNINQNININNNINRAKYQTSGRGQGSWQHNPEHRKNVAYRDNNTARQYGQSRGQSVQNRRDARGYGSGGQRGEGAATRPSAGTMDRRGAERGARGGGERTGAGTSAVGAGDRSAAARSADRSAAGRSSFGDSASRGRESAFSGGYGSGSQERMASDRGRASRQSASSFGSGAGGFGGGASRGGFRGGGGGRRR